MTFVVVGGGPGFCKVSSRAGETQISEICVSPARDDTLQNPGPPTTTTTKVIFERLAYAKWQFLILELHFCFFAISLHFSKFCVSPTPNDHFGRDAELTWPTTKTTKVLFRLRETLVFDVFSLLFFLLDFHEFASRRGETITVV